MTTSTAEARRSTRIRTQIPIRVVSADPRFAFSEHCHTLMVNLEGCGIRLLRPLEPGLPVSLEDLPCGRSVPARVANCAPLGDQGRYWLVGIALEQPENVWCIQPAPPDWEGKAEAPPAPEEPAKKSAQWPYTLFSIQGEAHPGRK